MAIQIYDDKAKSLPNKNNWIKKKYISIGIGEFPKKKKEKDIYLYFLQQILFEYTETIAIYSTCSSKNN